MSNPELEAAEEQIKRLQLNVRSLEQALERQTDTLNAQAAIIAQLQASLAGTEIDLNEEIRILKETVVTLATKGSQEPAAPSTPHSANSTLNMLSQMISSEATAQEREWRG